MFSGGKSPGICKGNGMKTADLIGDQLDQAVAKCLGFVHPVRKGYNAGEGWWERTASHPWYLDLDGNELDEWTPSTDYAQGMPIVEREMCRVFKNVSDGWTCQKKVWVKDDTDGVDSTGHYRWYSGVGPTLLIAGLRCYVASKLGNEVEIPKELT